MLKKSKRLVAIVVCLTLIVAAPISLSGCDDVKKLKQLPAAHQGTYKSTYLNIKRSIEAKATSAKYTNLYFPYAYTYGVKKYSGKTISGSEKYTAVLQSADKKTITIKANVPCGVLKLPLVATSSKKGQVTIVKIVYKK
ncbi:MAG: hypothetical protein LBB42_05490 [Coriobacteriales bacterium]|jgi:uncharacterized protein YceK|nr:hypothetical protein [Coriobacteriales bacterium]